MGLSQRLFLPLTPPMSYEAFVPFEVWYSAGFLARRQVCRWTSLDWQQHVWLPLAAASVAELRPLAKLLPFQSSCAQRSRLLIRLSQTLTSLSLRKFPPLCHQFTQIDYRQFHTLWCLSHLLPLQMLFELSFCSFYLSKGPWRHEIHGRASFDLQLPILELMYIV